MISGVLALLTEYNIEAVQEWRKRLLKRMVELENQLAAAHKERQAERMGRIRGQRVRLFRFEGMPIMCRLTLMFRIEVKSYDFE